MTDAVIRGRSTLRDRRRVVVVRLRTGRFRILDLRRVLRYFRRDFLGFEKNMMTSLLVNRGSVS